jgi:hypothetical protein
VARDSIVPVSTAEGRVACRIRDLAGDTSNASVGGQGQNRTADTVIFSHVLYQLSYLAVVTPGASSMSMRTSEYSMCSLLTTAP